MLRIDWNAYGADPAHRRGRDLHADGDGLADKTVRLWALPEGGRGAPTLLRTLRVPIGERDGGKIHAVALSPGGKWVAAGGWDAHNSVDKTMGVYIFEAATRRLGHPSGPLRGCNPSSRLLARR